MIGAILFLFVLGVMSYVGASVGDPCNSLYMQRVSDMLPYPSSVFGIHEVGIAEHIPYVSYKEVA